MKIFFVLLLVPYALFAQATSGNLLGTITTDGRPLAGVSVTVTSPSLQGMRTAISGEAGGYNLPSLPPGDYTAIFEMSGLQSVRFRSSVHKIIAGTKPAYAAPNQR